MVFPCASTTGRETAPARTNGVKTRADGSVHGHPPEQAGCEGPGLRPGAVPHRAPRRRQRGPGQHRVAPIAHATLRGRLAGRGFGITRRAAAEHATFQRRSRRPFRGAICRRMPCRIGPRGPHCVARLASAARGPFRRGDVHGAGQEFRHLGTTRGGGTPRRCARSRTGTRTDNSGSRSARAVTPGTAAP